MRNVALATLALLSACATGPQKMVAWPDDSASTQVKVLNRVTWGANRSSIAGISRLGTARFLGRQLEPQPEPQLPAEIQARIDAMSISQRSALDLATELEQRRRAFQEMPAEERKAAQRAYQEELGRLAREAQSRMLLRALYSPDQLKEQMTWFWMNHFSVFQFKFNLRALVADYEESAIRPHALGRFRELLRASAHHPAMLIYLDNAQNAAGRVNENYARELLELHTLGVNGGYTQRDVQELARVLTGFSVNLVNAERRIRPVMLPYYRREGLFEFIPGRHDFGDKELLGHTIRGRGPAELDEALELLARHPSTARFVSRKLAMHFVADEPPPALVERMAQAFLASDGDIAAVLREMFASSEFRASLGGKFKDPLHYVVSALRLALDERPLAETAPVIGALALLGEPLYARATPDGYPLTRTDWSSPGQLATRFDVARAMAERVPYKLAIEGLGAATREALAKAASVQEWNMLLLASPEFMQR